MLTSRIEGTQATMGDVLTYEATGASDHLAIDVLQTAGVLRETTGRQRDRLYAYQRYLDVLAADTA